jgi:hypothetical protein
MLLNGMVAGYAVAYPAYLVGPPLITRSSGMVRIIIFIYGKSHPKFGNGLVNLWKVPEVLESSETIHYGRWRDSTSPSRPTKWEGGVHGGLHHLGRPHEKEREESLFL